jgi:hypothetical protein
MGVVVTGSRLTTIGQVFLADHVTVTKVSWVEGVEPALERQMNSESFVDLEHERSWHRAEPVSDTLNRHRSHLFGLGFGVSVQSAGRGRQENLKRVHPSDVGGHWHHGDHPTAELGGGGVGAVVGDDDRRSATCGFSR